MDLIAFEAMLRERAASMFDEDEFIKSLSYEEDVRCRSEIGVPCSFWDRVKSEAHPMRCRVRWVKPVSLGGPWKTTPDANLAFGIAYSDGTDTRRGLEKPEPGVPLLICEQHWKTHDTGTSWHLVSLPEDGSPPFLRIENVFKNETYLAIVQRLLAFGGSAPFDALRADQRADHYYPVGMECDPRNYGWRVRDLADAGWLIARVVGVGTGYRASDATIEGKVTFSPAFIQVFGLPAGQA